MSRAFKSFWNIFNEIRHKKDAVLAQFVTSDKAVNTIYSIVEDLKFGKFKILFPIIWFVSFHSLQFISINVIKICIILKSVLFLKNFSKVVSYQ